MMSGLGSGRCIMREFLAMGLESVTVLGSGPELEARVRIRVRV